MTQGSQPQKKLRVEINPDSFGTMAPGENNKNALNPPRLMMTNFGPFTSEFKYELVLREEKVDYVKAWFDPIDMSHPSLDQGQTYPDPKPIFITVPADPVVALAGVYHIEVRVRDLANPGEPDGKTVTLNVQRKGDYSVSVEPGEVIAGAPSAAAFKLSVMNNANAPLQLSLKDAPPTAPFTFSISPSTIIMIDPSKTQSFTVTVTPKDNQSLPQGNPIDLVTEGSYQLAGGGSEQASAHTQRVTWPLPSGPTLSITSVDPLRLALVPGQKGELTLTLINRGRDTQLSLRIEGLPEDWVAIPPVLALHPGEQEIPPIVISAPQDRAQALAGAYPLTIHAAGTASQEEATAPVSMVVELDGEPRTEIIPTKREVQNGEQSAEFVISIQNDSNATLQMSLGDSQSANLLDFKFDQSEIKVAPTQAEKITLTVNLKQPMKESRTDLFTIAVQRVFLLKDDTKGKEDTTRVGAEVHWISSLPTVPATLRIDARDPKGTAYTNTLDRAVTITFVALGQWCSIPLDEKEDIPKGPVDAEGYPNFPNPNAPCPHSNLGALVVRTEQDECISGGKQGVITLQPRQTVYFVMNDVKGLYGDNSGHLTAVITEAPTTLRIDARDPKGTAHTNTLDREVTIAFVALGQWCAIPLDEKEDIPKGPVDAEGYSNFPSPDAPCPHSNLGALVVRTEQDECISGGKQGIITLQPRQTVYFVMNDVKGRYGDNSGHLTVVIAEAAVVTIYEDENFAGKSASLGLGRHDLEQIGIANDSLSSLKVPTGMATTLYEDIHFGGRSKTFTRDTSYVGDDFNDITSSIVVEITSQVS